MVKGVYLGVDYGAKWLGISFTDPEHLMVLPGPFLYTDNEEKKVDYIVEICTEKRVKKIVLGVPLTEAGAETKQAMISRKFADLLKKKINIPIEFYDETLTTFAAQEKGAFYGVKFTKGEEDSIAAMILLENYLKKEE